MLCHTGFGAKAASLIEQYPTFQSTLLLPSSWKHCVWLNK